MACLLPACPSAFGLPPVGSFIHDVYEILGSLPPPSYLLFNDFAILGPNPLPLIVDADVIYGCFLSPLEGYYVTLHIILARSFDSSLS